MPRHLPPSLRGRPFTGSEAAAAGVTVDGLRSRRIKRILQGVYADSDLPLTLDVRVRAARLVLPPDAVVTGVTGLHLWGVTIGDPCPLVFASTHPHVNRRPGVRVMRVSAPPPSSGSVAVPVACFLSAASDLSLVDAVSVGDCMVRRGLATPADLVAAAAQSRGRGSRLSRAAAALVRERVDSPRETWLRLCLVLAHLPEPQTNVVVGNSIRPIGRVDLLLSEYGIVHEYEGDHHRIDRGQWEHDLGRYEDLTAAGYVVLRVTALRCRRPRAIVLTTYARLVERGYTGPAPTFDASWCSLFEA